MTFLLAFVNLFIIGAVAHKMWRRQPIPAKFVFWPALLMKLGAGVCLGVIYMYYYQGIGDTVLYFEDSSRISELARRGLMSYIEYLWRSNLELGLVSDAAGQPRSIYLLKVASVFNLLSQDNYWITATWFSFVSFVTSWYLVTQVARTVPSAYWPSVVGFLFFPTAVFWSSGLIKESLAMAGIYLLSGCFIRSWFSLRIRVWEMVAMPIALWLVWSLKYYFLGALAPVAVASLVVHKLYRRGFSGRGLPAKIFTWFVVMIVPLVVVSSLHPNFYPHVIMEVIVDNYKVFHELSKPDDLIYYNNLQPTPGSLLVNSPKAIFSGLFRPLLWEGNSDLQVLAAIENTLLLLLTIAAALNLPALWKSRFRLLIVTVIVYSLALAAFLALSTPNFGTLSRYKVGFLSFLVTVLLLQNPLIIRVLRFLQRYRGNLAR
ncbi:hypothetical protein WBG78_19520 [Chryseolinea sp. T2]|uniref:hypothetical protein n=1 Tax=Chryseolinea sp. T2 TaxID=3129255 RepID=UPI003077FD3E